MTSVSPISGISPLTSLSGSSAAPAADNGQSFSSVLGSALDQVNQLQEAAQQSAVDLAAGKAPDIQTVMITTEKASLAVDLAVQVQSKVVEAYQQIMQMQI